MNQSCTVHGMVLLLLLFLCCIGAAHGAGWEMEFLRLEPTALKDEPRYRVDLYAPANGAPASTVVQAIVCYSAHAIRVGDTCESPGFARQYLSTDRLTLLVAALPGMHALVDVRTSDGDRCTKALPGSMASGEEVKHVVGVVTSGTDSVPWYYYTIVIIACCVIGVAVLTVALGVYQGKQYPYSVSFVDAYRSNSVKNKRIAAETLGLFQPSTVLIDEED